MANLLTNAAFLDGSTGWAKSAQLAFAVDETVRGAPGRAALIASGVTTATNQAQTVSAEASARAAVTSGATVEVSCAALATVNGAITPVVATVVWHGAGGSTIGTETLSLRDPQITRHGIGLRGVRATWPQTRQRLTVPAGAVAADLRLGVTPAASGSAVVIALLKPQIAEIPIGRSEPLAFTPGLHAAEDLALPAWPQTLRPFDLGPDGEPLPSGVEFQGESPGRPAMRRTGLSPARQFAGSLRCDPYERAVLDDFWRDTPGDFWIVEPGSDRLCVGRFAVDGQPRLTEDRGETATINLNLWLETA
ncbi:hypothetical protein GVN18_39260 [Pseudomonas sp. ODNR1LW]|nr:hypothetical protein [Pseudomonas sp. ODNR1LW]